MRGAVMILGSATILDTPSEVALLGQSFLGRIDQVSIAGGRMTLTKS